jgi:prolyl oligopeptidase
MAVPQTRAVDQVDEYFGTSVADPYRWLEDGDDPEVVAWLQAQGAYTRGELDALPDRDRIAATLARAIRVPRSGLPVHRGRRWFRTANDGTQQQDVLLVEDAPFGSARTLIDPNGCAGEASTSLAEWCPSADGTLVVYSYSEAGSDWRTWRVREVASGADLADTVSWSKFTEPCWLPDGSGFLYNVYDAPSGDEYVASNINMRVMLHRLGTQAADDTVLLALPDEPDITFETHISDDDHWAVITGRRGTDYNARVWVHDLTRDESPRLLVPKAEACWELVGAVGGELLMITDLDAPRQRIVALDPDTGSVRSVLEEGPDQLTSALVAGGRLVVCRLHNAASLVTVHDLDGTELEALALPGLGTVTALEGRPDEQLVHLGWSTFVAPPAVLAWSGGDAEVVFAVPLECDLVTEQLWVDSTDSARIPVFLTHRPGLSNANGPHSAWLYGYGGFRIPVTPEFEPTRYAFAAAGGLVAVACLRGGGEFGSDWHDAGRLMNKQHVFDDAIATAEHLIESGWTTADRLALSGGSNGGLLAGAVLTQRPDLFAAVIPEVGVLDMLRFAEWTIGWAWYSDYGDPRADAEQFAALYRYSPLHNLRADAGYPPVLVMTRDHDDRVVPAHSMKFAARLQAVSPPDAIALLRVGTAAGHGAGRSHDALIAERVDVLAFLSRYTGLHWSQ